LLKFQLLFSDVTIPAEVASTVIDLLSDECNYKEPKCKGKSINNYKSLKAKFNGFAHIWVQGIILFDLPGKDT
jgi:hypothetical protein